MPRKPRKLSAMSSAAQAAPAAATALTFAAWRAMVLAAGPDAVTDAAAEVTEALDADGEADDAADGSHAPAGGEIPASEPPDPRLGGSAWRKGRRRRQAKQSFAFMKRARR